MRGIPALPILAAFALAVPAGAFAQSAGDEQYTDPFGGQDPAAQQESPTPEEPAAPPPSGATEPAPGGNGGAEPAPAAEAAQEVAPTLPRTGAPVLLFAAAGYALLLAGVAIRRQA